MSIIWILILNGFLLASCWLSDTEVLLLANDNLVRDTFNNSGQRMPPMDRLLPLRRRYHMISSLDYSEGTTTKMTRVIIEEWAYLEEQLFRIDLMWSNQVTRKSYLFLGRTNEVFEYEPYTCKSHVSPTGGRLSADLGILSHLFRRHNLNNSALQIYGVGPLWMLADTQRHIGRHSVLQFNQQENEKKLLSYNVYTYDKIAADKDGDLNDDESSIRFLFYIMSNKNAIRLPVAIEWLNGSSSNNNNSQVYASLTPMIFDQLFDDQQVFAVPEGYGCVRNNAHHNANADGTKNGTNDDYNRWPSASLDYRSTPYEVSLEIVATLFDKTANYSVVSGAAREMINVRVFSGSLTVGGDLHTYHVAESPAYDRRSATKERHRLKRVFDVYHEIMYTMDLTTGQCKIERSAWDLESELDALFYSLDANVRLPLHPVELDLLLHETVGFSEINVIRGTSTDGGEDDGARTYVLERRLPNFSLLQGVKAGHTSVVRRVSKLPAIRGAAASASATTDTGATEWRYETKVSVFIYTDDCRHQQAHLEIRVRHQNSISESYLHRQLDVSSCYPSAKQRSTITVLYPLFDLDAMSSANAMLNAAHDTLYEQWLDRVLELDFVDPLQLSNVRMTYDADYLYLTMCILEQPTLDLLFMKTDNETLVQSGNTIVQLHASASQCADTCQFYQCSTFSYCWPDKQCIVESSGGTRALVTAPVERREQCQHYRDWPDRVRLNAKPHDIVQWLKSTLETPLTDEQVHNSTATAANKHAQLELELMSSDGQLDRLLPVAIESDLDEVDDYFENLSNNWNGSFNNDDDAVNLIARYSLMLDGREFAKTEAPNHWVLEHVSYDECAHLCSDHVCDTFSYCDSTRACHATTLPHTDQVTANSKVNALCNIYERDNLSKFVRFEHVPRQTWSNEQLQVVSARQCANQCVDTQEYECLSFDFCHTETRATKRSQNSGHNSDDNCFLHKRHLTARILARSVLKQSHDHSHQRSNNSSHDYDTDESDANGSCDHYSRSYIEDFTHYANKKLVALMDSHAAYYHLCNTNIESCAAACIARERCVAFHLCYNAQSSDRRQECALADAPVRRTNVVREPLCSTYLLSPQSEYFTLERRRQQNNNSSSNSSMINTQSDDSLEQPDDVAPVERNTHNDSTAFNHTQAHHESKSKMSSGILKGLSIMIYGIALGIACIMIYENRHMLARRIRLQ